MQNEYLDKVSALLKNKRAKAQILPELESHIEEKIDYYREIGYDEEEAQKHALAEMGDPEETALSLNSLHNEKWYKIPFNIITVLILVVIGAILLICPQKFAYCDVYYNVVHDVIFDLLSLGIFSAYVVLLMLARRFRSKFVPIAVAVFLILQIITSLLIAYNTTEFGPSYYADLEGSIPHLFASFSSVRYIAQSPLRVITSVFQPFLYGIFTLFTKGPSAYIDSLFGYAYISDSYSVAFTVGTVLIYALLIIWSVFCFINVARGERMKNTKNLNRMLKIGGRTAAIFTALCIVATSVSTALAYSVIDYKISENQFVREQMINCAVNIDFSKAYDEIAEEMKKIKMGNLTNDEYRIEHSYYYGKDSDDSALFGYCKDNNFIELNYDLGSNNSFAIMYATTTPGIPSPLNKYLYVKTEDFEEFCDSRRSLYPTTLEEFLDSGMQNYATVVYVSEGFKQFIFLRDPESDDYNEERKMIYIYFDENNLMTNNSAKDEYIDYVSD
ncbi:MAG: hypothetical protein J1E96_03810 [Ruminococcus sp.]|nr:hypothetical protein [Ruminococcus sp.]